MNESTVHLEKSHHVARITLSRPHVLNALDLATHARLAEIWDEVESDDEVWAAVLTGAGDRAFSSGQDLTELGRRLRGGPVRSSIGSHGMPGHPRLTERFRMSKPIVARVNGLALGGGFELVLACDVVVAAEHAYFGLPEARLGLVAGAGGVFRLTRQAPFRAALGHVLTGRRISAAQALAYGLVNDVVPATELDDCVDEWVADILRCAPLAVRAAKEMAYASAARPLAEAFAARYDWEDRRMASADAVEGPTAFLERRQPVWQGR
ncbi:enoyl-CoA hydratase [Micromonospora orduensis]|uniref:Enoyl-CoA hydratase n=1 Tax=Micromonospora orduensis TaxID=1420891 RepID=A0A5C4QA41_9ACTN|nr:enoyl-CoA-hydratase DpgD [Micromonospora orduensis]TNH22696.1 enoyl-CoA hydratase [Micromonospora orduensis]